MLKKLEPIANSLFGLILKLSAESNTIGSKFSRVVELFLGAQSDSQTITNARSAYNNHNFTQATFPNLARVLSVIKAIATSIFQPARLDSSEKETAPPEKETAPPQPPIPQDLDEKETAPPQPPIPQDLDEFENEKKCKYFSNRPSVIQTNSSSSPDFQQLLKELADVEFNKNPLYSNLLNDPEYNFVDLYLTPALEKYLDTHPILCKNAVSNVIKQLNRNDTLHDSHYHKIKAIVVKCPQIMNSITGKGVQKTEWMTLSKETIEILNCGDSDKVISLFMSFHTLLKDKSELEIRTFYVNVLNSIEDQHFVDRLAIKHRNSTDISHRNKNSIELECLEFLFYNVSKGVAKRWNRSGQNWDDEVREYVAASRAAIEKWQYKNASNTNGAQFVDKTTPAIKIALRPGFDYSLGSHLNNFWEFWLGKNNIHMYEKEIDLLEGLHTTSMGQKVKIDPSETDHVGFVKYLQVHKFVKESKDRQCLIDVLSLPEINDDWNNLGLMDGHTANPTLNTLHEHQLIFYSKADPKRGLKSVALSSHFFHEHEHLGVQPPRYSSIKEIRPYQQRLADEIGLFPEDGEMDDLLVLMAKYYYYGAQCPIVYRGGAECNEMEFVGLCLAKGYLPPLQSFSTEMNASPSSMFLEATCKTEDAFIDFFVACIKERGGLKRIYG